MHFPRPTTRRGRIVVGLASIAAVGLICAAAAFVFFGKAHIDGAVKSGNFAPAWSSIQVDQQTGMTCSPTVAGGRLNLQVTNAFPGGDCKFSGNVSLATNASTSGRIAGLQLTLPAGWTSALTIGCGANLDPGATISVSFDVDMGEDAAADGSTTALDPQDALLVAPTGTALQCTP